MNTILRLAIAFSMMTPVDALAQRERPLVVGHLRSDGLAIPFVQFTSDGPAHASSRAIYLVDTWLFQDWDGNESTVENGNPVTLTDEWYDFSGVVTNYSPRDLDPYRRPVTRVGVVASDSIEMSGFDRIVRGFAWDDELSLVPPDYTWIFDRVAAEILAAEASGGTIIDPQNPIEMTRLFRSRQQVAGATLYYAEAVRDLGDCRGWHRFHSWIFEEPEGTRFQSPIFEQTDCDFKGSSFVEPWMVLEHGGESYIMMEVRWWEGGERRLMRMDVSDGRALLEVRLPN